MLYQAHIYLGVNQHNEEACQTSLLVAWCGMGQGHGPLHHQGGSSYLAQDCQAGLGFHLRLLQLHHSNPAIFVQILFIIAIAESQGMHLEEEEGKGHREADEQVHLICFPL